MLRVTFSVTTTITFAFRVTWHPCVKTFTIFFLALGFFTIAHFLLGRVFASVFSYHPHALNFLVILVSIRTSAATTLLRAHSPWRKALAVKLQAACFFTHTSALLFLFWSFKTLIGPKHHFLYRWVILIMLVLLYGGLLEFVHIMKVPINVVIQRF